MPISTPQKTKEPKVTAPEKAKVPQVSTPQKAKVTQVSTPQKKSAPQAKPATQNKNTPNKSTQPQLKATTPPPAPTKSPAVTPSKKTPSNEDHSVVKTALLVRPPKDQKAVASPWARKLRYLVTIAPSSEVFSKVVPVTNKTK
ncbi:hypothetical protein OSTOST_16705 [Ostertagia ostertagi]